MTPEKNKKLNKGEVKRTLKTLVGYVRPQAALIILSLLAAIGSAVLQLLGPTYATDAVNVISAGITGELDMDAFMHYLFIEIGIYGGMSVLMWLQGYMMTTVTQQLTRRMRRDISCKINKLPLSFFDSSSHGDTLSRVTNDSDTVGQSLNQSVITLVTAVIMLVGSTVMMFVTSPILAAAAIGSTVIGFVAMALIMKKSQRYYVGQQKALGEVDGHIEETFSGQLVVKAYGAEDVTGKRFKGINKKLYESAWRAQFFGAMMSPLMAFVGNLGYVAVMAVGAVLAVNGGGVTIGTIIAFTLYVQLFSQPLSQLAQVMTQFQPATAAAARVFEFLQSEDMRPEKPGAVRHVDVRGDVTFKDVRFGYSPDRTIINDFSAEIKAGQKVAIVGPTGAGKTTLVNLLMRFYELDGGNIYIDGIPIDGMTREAVHDVFGMVLQDTWLFKGTVRDNIEYSKTGVRDGAVEEACKKAGLEHYIMTLPQGYDTVIDEGANVSAGQRQLMTIARAMVEDAPMLILDEATSSVDTRTEIIIQQAMDELTKGRTSFVIAHRLSTIKNADLILVMDKGDIVESGTHEELLKRHGFYYELYTAQFA